jgi:uncharacterized membrane protein
MSDSAPRSIAQYLEQLRVQMADDDPAMLQDALYDAEEYLRAEVTQHPETSEADVLEAIAVSYGAPAEVAEAYRTTEVKVKAALASPRPPEYRSALGRFFGVYTDVRSYSALFYLLLSLATGIFYFTFAVTGLSLSVGLAILIIGVPVFLLFIGITRVISLAEGRLVEALLGTRMPRRPVLPAAAAGSGWLTRIGAMLKDPRTWTTVAYLILMLPLGIVYFTVAATGLSVAVALIGGPLAGLLAHAGWIHTTVAIEPDMSQLPLVALPVVLLFGIVLLTAMLHLIRGLGRLHGRIAKALLVTSA